MRGGGYNGKDPTIFRITLLRIDRIIFARGNAGFPYNIVHKHGQFRTI